MSKPIIVIIASVLIVLLGYSILSNKANVAQVSNMQEQASRNSVSLKPSGECSGTPIPSLTEGPYYKSGSPETKNIKEGSEGESMTLTGFVFDTDCKPIAGAWIDFWQADENGNYDLAGYKFRGHQLTDKNGFYTLETIVPPPYSGRTPHIHFKIRANENSPIITSQLFLPGEEQNQTDSIFNDALIMKVSDVEGEKQATFNFVVTAN